MITNKIYQFTVMLAMLFIFPMVLFSQEDISVEFSFKKPNEYVCEIRNMIDNPIIIWLNKVQSEGQSELFFDIVGLKNDTTRYVYYGLMRDVNNQRQVLRLNPGQVYTISHRDGYTCRFIKARVYIKYHEEIPDNKVKFHDKTFDLIEVKNRAYIPQVVREDEE
jgi:hypothetical protein